MTWSNSKVARCYRVLFGVISLGFLLMCFGVLASPARAQSAASASIRGAVKDQTGAALPGVTATLTSPALQVGQMVTVSESDGAYRFMDLPAGTYRVTFELPSFGTFIREDLRLNVGFAATVDAILTLGAMAESVVVSGQSPVVDLTSTSTAANFTEEVLNTVPRGRDIWSVVAMTPGVTTAGAPDVGGSNMGTRKSMQTYGVSAQPKLEVEGINVTSGGDENSSVYLNYFGIDEIQFKTSGTDAEVGVPGLLMLAVLKSGGNSFHGRYEGSYQGSKTQSNNLTASLRAQGLSNTVPLKYHFDAAGDLGGRIIKDKLWFYGGYSRQQEVTSVLGFVSGLGPDGKYLTGDEPLADYSQSLTGNNLKLSWQISGNNRLTGAYMTAAKRQPQNGGGRFRPLEATRDYEQRSWVKKVGFQSTMGSRWLIDVVGGDAGLFADYSSMRTSFYNQDSPSPSRLDRETGLRTGGHPASDQRPRNKYQVDGGISFFPERSLVGRHGLKTGVTVYDFRRGEGTLDHPFGNYVLVFDKVNGVSGTPVQIQINNNPLSPDNRVMKYAWYLKDEWQITSRLTANLGIRWEYQKAWLPPQSREASPQFPTLFPAGSFAGRDVLTWKRPLPRVGLAWNLDGKSVVKTSFGLYNYLMRDTLAGNFNQNQPIIATYVWHDPDGNGNYTPGEVNLGLNGPDFISITGARNNILNKNLKQPMATEVTASFEREVAKDLGVHAVYVFKRLTDSYDEPGPNILRPASAYNIPITRRDPGPDGVLSTPDDGGRVTFYDYDAAYRGAAFVGNQMTNSSNDDWNHAIEFGFSKRQSGRWMASASFFAMKNHAWLTNTFQSPNDLFFPLNETWTWAGNANGSYRFPWDIQVAGFLQSKQGVRGQRTYVFRTVDPDGGTPISQLNTVTLPLEPYGTRKGAAINVVNLRVTKAFLLAGDRLEFNVDLFNALNSSSPNAINFRGGSTFGYITAVTPPRIVRLGASFSF